MYNEQECSSYKISKYPIEIEHSQMGVTIDVLMNALTGDNSLDPYNNVSFRVLQRMADILMNQTEIEAMFPYYGGVDVIENLKDYYF